MEDAWCRSILSKPLSQKVPNAMFIKPSQSIAPSHIQTSLLFPAALCRWHIWILSLWYHWFRQSLILSSGWHEHRMKRTRKKFMTFWIGFLNITSISCSFAQTGRTASAMRYNWITTKKTFCRLNIYGNYLARWSGCRSRSLISLQMFWIWMTEMRSLFPKSWLRTIKVAVRPHSVFARSWWTSNWLPRRARSTLLKFWSPLLFTIWSTIISASVPSERWKCGSAKTAADILL